MHPPIGFFEYRASFLGLKDVFTLNTYDGRGLGFLLYVLPSPSNKEGELFETKKGLPKLRHQATKTFWPPENH